jgi:hypothetical protein
MFSVLLLPHAPGVANISTVEPHGLLALDSIRHGHAAGLEVRGARQQPDVPLQYLYVASRWSFMKSTAQSLFGQ